MWVASICFDCVKVALGGKSVEDPNPEGNTHYKYLDLPERADKRLCQRGLWHVDVQLGQTGNPEDVCRGCWEERHRDVFAGLHYVTSAQGAPQAWQVSSSGSVPTLHRGWAMLRVVFGIHVGHAFLISEWEPSILVHWSSHGRLMSTVELTESQRLWAPTWPWSHRRSAVASSRLSTFTHSVGGFHSFISFIHLISSLNHSSIHLFSILWSIYFHRYHSLIYSCNNILIIPIMFYQPFHYSIHPSIYLCITIYSLLYYCLVINVFIHISVHS